jgi:hypothetical protein
LEAAITAAEHYMKALRLAPADEKKKLDTKCKELIIRAEKIKRATDWQAVAPQAFPSLRPPTSTRKLTTREEIIILEGAKLNGYIFPPWSRAPNEDEFILKDRPFTYVENSISNHSNLLIEYRDSPDLHLSDVQRDIFAGWKRPHDLLKNAGNPGATSPTISASGQTDLVQDVLTDCSVVASLCATTSRSERRLGQV